MLQAQAETDPGRGNERYVALFAKIFIYYLVNY